MADNVEHLVLERISRLDEKMDKLTARMDNLTAEVRASNAHVAAIVTSDLHQNSRLAEIEVRLDRIEKRLDIVS